MTHWRILVVDDEPDVREVLQEFLETLGHEVVALASGRETVDYLADSTVRFDLAIVDWNMPGIAGRDVIEGIKERTPSTAVLITTGQVGDSLRRGRGAATAAQILQKPFSLQKLREVLDQVLGLG